MFPKNPGSGIPIGTVRDHVTTARSVRKLRKILTCCSISFFSFIHSFTLALVRILKNATISTERVLVSTSSHRYPREKTPLSPVHLRLRDFCSTPPCARRAYHSQAKILVETEDFLASYEPPTPNPPEIDPVPIPPRFDWRLRAISREKTKPDKKRKHKRRIAPQQTVLQEHEPYYHTVHRYSEQCVAFSYLRTRLDSVLLVSMVSSMQRSQRKRQYFINVSQPGLRSDFPRKVIALRI